MSKVEQIEADLQSLSPAELKQGRDWLDDFVEDRLEVSPSCRLCCTMAARTRAATAGS